MVGDDSGRVYAAACYCVAAEALATRPEVTVGHRCHGRTLRASLDPKNYVSRFFPAGFRAHDPFANITGMVPGNYPPETCAETGRTLNPCQKLWTIDTNMCLSVL